MAEEKEQENDSGDIAKKKKEGGAGKGITTVVIVLLVINIAVMGGIAFVTYTTHLTEKNKETLQDVVEGDKQDSHQKAQKHDEGGFLCPMDPFIVNLSGTGGGVYAKVEFSLELNTEKACKEVEVRKPQIRDMIIVILSSKTYEQVETQEGKQNLREEIKHAINGFLTSGEVKNIYFTQMIVQ